MKKRLITRDDDYFKNNEESIKLEHCADKGEKCRVQMVIMNENLLLARKMIENKEFTRSVEVIRKAFESTYMLKEKQCQGCAELFRNFIAQSLNQLVDDLEQLTTGFLASKKYVSDLENARKLLQEFRKQQPT